MAIQPVLSGCITRYGILKLDGKVSLVFSVCLLLLTITVEYLLFIAFCIVCFVYLIGDFQNKEKNVSL